MEELIAKHWYHLPTTEVFDLLEMNLNKGLDTFEIRHRQKHFTSNILYRKKGNSKNGHRPY